jgi:hypothetical protein
MTGHTPFCFEKRTNPDTYCPMSNDSQGNHPDQFSLFFREHFMFSDVESFLHRRLSVRILPVLSASPWMGARSGYADEISKHEVFPTD